MDINDVFCKEKLEITFKDIDYYDPGTGNCESMF